MELPLFKGIGEDQLSLMLEKTSVEFFKFEEGDVICEADENVTALNFILGGRVRLTYELDNFKIGVDEILSRGAVIGATHLFGLDTTFSSTCVALGRVSLMRIGKAQYMNILQSDRIYMLNFVNYLSAATQRMPSLMKKVKEPSVNRMLTTLANTFVSRLAETVMVAGDDKELARYCGISDKEFNEWKTSEMAHNRIIANQRGIILKSPHLFR